MDSSIQVSLVSNAGVLLQIGTEKILLDALWQQSADYSAPPSAIYEQMLNGAADSKWRNADYLLFTHLHNDHFAQNKVIEYLEHNSVRAVWFERPDCLYDNIGDSSLLLKYLQVSDVAYREFNLQRGQYKRIELSDTLAITAICTEHMGINAHQDHIAIVVHSDSKNILFVTDAEFPLAIFKQALVDIQLDAVFLNPVHFYSRRALNFVVEELAAKKLVVYHLPFAGEGNSVFRRMVIKKLPAISERLPVQVLWNVGDCVTI